MTIFPSNSYKCDLNENNKEIWERLSSNTELTRTMVTVKTRKKFIGQVEPNYFKLISSKVGKGAFCVSEGCFEESQTNGIINFEVNKPFRILLSIWLLLPLIGVLSAFINNGFVDALGILLMLGGFLLLLRFIVFKLFSSLTENRLQELREILNMKNMERVETGD